MNKKTKRWIKAMLLVKRLYGCHQLPERSFFIGGYQFPLCARCTGITIGYLFALLLCILQIIVPLWLSFFMIMPLIVDGGVQLLFCVMSNNIRRFVTGLVFGTGFIHISANIIIYLMSF